MKKADFVAKAAKATGVSKKDVMNILDYYTKSIINEVKEGRVARLFGLGNMKTVYRAAKRYSNRMSEAKTVVKFSPFKNILL